MSPSRHQTQTERDLEGLAAKKIRESQLAIPHEVKDAATGVATGAALWKIRHDRSPEERLDHADERMDKLMDELIASRAFVRTFLLKVLGIIGLVVSAYLAGKHL